MTDTWQTPFLQGLLAPVFDERDDRDLEVIGEIPAGLRGMFVRTGPNPQFAPLGAYHPFDGDGMVHAVYLEDGTARYRNRWVESKGLLAERARGEPRMSIGLLIGEVREAVDDLPTHRRGEQTRLAGRRVGGNAGGAWHTGLLPS